MDFKCGTILDNYKLLARVGAGSCGTVWQAENVVSGEIEALKILSNDALAERELRALKLYREIDHKNLIRIRHVGKTGDTLFYTMDWCDTSLAEKKLSPAELLDAAKHLSSALAMLHSKGLLHRDIKPANVFFRQGVPVLGDIGLLTLENGATIAGSPGFLSPSILAGTGSADRYSDCYALAKSLYCSLSGFEPEQFPCYDGELTPEASLLMRAMIAVCGKDSSIDTAEKLLDFLNNPPTQKRGNFPVLLLTGISAAVIIALCAAYWICVNGTTEEKAEKPDVQEITEEGQTPVPVKPEIKIDETVKIADNVVRSANAVSHDTFKPEPPSGQKNVKLAEAEKKFDAIKRSKEAYSMLGDPFTFDPNEADVEAVENALTPENFSRYKSACESIRKCETSRTWKKLSSDWTNFSDECRKLIRNAERENLDPVKLLQDKAKTDKTLAFWLNNGQVRLTHGLLVKEAKKSGEAASASSRLDDFLASTGQYVKRFAGFNNL